MLCYILPIVCVALSTHNAVQVVHGLNLRTKSAAPAAFSDPNVTGFHAVSDVEFVEEADEAYSPNCYIDYQTTEPEQKPYSKTEQDADTLSKKILEVDETRNVSTVLTTQQHPEYFFHVTSTNGAFSMCNEGFDITDEELQEQLNNYQHKFTFEGKEFIAYVHRTVAEAYKRYSAIFHYERTGKFPELVFMNVSMSVENRISNKRRSEEEKVKYINLGGISDEEKAEWSKPEAFARMQATPGLRGDFTEEQVQELMSMAAEEGLVAKISRRG